jgi:ubiquinone/menaquinone biosynthesis C-methylase UbiE
VDGSPIRDTVEAYDDTAAAYAERWFDFRLTRDMARFVRYLQPGTRVLDVGCGPGRDLLWLVEQGFDAVGVDLSFQMLTQGRTRGVVVPFIQADMRCLPFRGGSFGGIWACASLLHIPKDRAGDVLRELARVLRAGPLYLSVKRGEGESWVEDGRGSRFFFAYYTPTEIRSLVERSGLQLLSCWESEDQAGRERSWIGVLAWNGVELPSMPDLTFSTV